jgi:FHA domain
MWSLMTPRGQVLAVPRLPAVLGSGSDADVRVPHESVAAQHARLTEGSAGTLRVEALSEDAVLGVGGKRVPRALLRDGDELVLGRVKFTLCAAAADMPAMQAARAAAAASSALGGSASLTAPTASAAPTARAASVASSASSASAAPVTPVTSTLAAARAAARGPLAAPQHVSAEPELLHRSKSLQFGKVEARRGLLAADLSQLPTGLRLLLIVGGLALAGGLMYGVMKLFGLFA